MYLSLPDRIVAEDRDESKQKAPEERLVNRMCVDTEQQTSCLCSEGRQKWQKYVITPGKGATFVLFILYAMLNKHIWPFPSVTSAAQNPETEIWRPQR
jgi:hypothetical protein